MQSEGGAAGAVHGALQAGALATTFTASQGLLLMIPNMYKIAGELTPFACTSRRARSRRTRSRSSATTPTSWPAGRRASRCSPRARSRRRTTSPRSRTPATLARASRSSTSSTASAPRTRSPRSRSSPTTTCARLIDEDDVAAHRARALTPDRPSCAAPRRTPTPSSRRARPQPLLPRRAPTSSQATMDRFAERTGRRYRLFDYVGHPRGRARHRPDGLGRRDGPRDGRLARRRAARRSACSRSGSSGPSTSQRFVARAAADRPRDRRARPHQGARRRRRAALPGRRRRRSRGARRGAPRPTIVGGRYGLSSKEFTPAMVKAVFDELARTEPRNHFTVGIVDDVTHTSLPCDPELDIEPDDVSRAVFFGLGADGTVGANKNSIKIIGEETDNYAQGYFVYDSKKSGAVTVSHLRFGPRPIRSAYLIRRAGFVACHQFEFLDRYDVLETARAGRDVPAQRAVRPRGGLGPAPARGPGADRREAAPVLRRSTPTASRARPGLRAGSTRSCRPASSRSPACCPARRRSRRSRRRSRRPTGRRAPRVVRAQLRGRRPDARAPRRGDGARRSHVDARPAAGRPGEAPDFVQRVTAVMLAGKGDLLPVSAFPVDGTWPTGTAQWEKRNIAAEIPVWDPKLCIQCNKCALVCPHAAIRAKVYEPERSSDGAGDVQVRRLPGRRVQGLQATRSRSRRRTAPAARSASWSARPRTRRTRGTRRSTWRRSAPLRERRARELRLLPRPPDPDRTRLRQLDVKGSQFLQPLFEYSGACAGCGETPYLKLLTQLFGDRPLIANATGCSSIYGGNLPTTPYTVDRDGRGPAWSNSLFEDNAEFGLGMRLAPRQPRARRRGRCSRALGRRSRRRARRGDPRGRPADEAGIARAARAGRAPCSCALAARSTARGAAPARTLADYLVQEERLDRGRRRLGLRHRLRRPRPRALAAPTTSTSSSSTPRSTPTPAASSPRRRRSAPPRSSPSRGKETGKKDLGLMAMSYGHVYVARVAFGAKDMQTVQGLPGGRGLPRAVARSSPTATASPTATTWRSAASSRSCRATRASGRSTASIPRAARRREPPLQLDSAPPKAPLEDTCATRAASAWSRSRTRSASSACSADAARARRGAPPRRSTEQLADWTGVRASRPRRLARPAAGAR